MLACLVADGAALKTLLLLVVAGPVHAIFFTCPAEDKCGTFFTIPLGWYSLKDPENCAAERVCLPSFFAFFYNLFFGYDCESEVSCGKIFFKFTSGELDMDPSFERRVSIAKELEGNLDASFMEIKDPILSTDECSVLKKHADAELEKTVAKGITEMRGAKITEDFVVDITPSELKNLIGMDSIRAMYKTFKEFNPDFPVSRINVRRTALTGGKHIHYHVDGASMVMHVWLNGGDELDGGNFFYLGQNNTTKIETTMGAATVHGKEIVHGISSFNGTRYTLLFVGDRIHSKDVLTDMMATEQVHAEL